MDYFVDADSQDGTKELSKNLPKQKNIKWISENDNEQLYVNKIINIFNF